jgi:superfamily II DNA/RNA helicase
LLDLQCNKYQNQYLNQNNSTWPNSSNQFKTQLNTYYKNDISNSLLRNPVHVEAAIQATTAERVKQCVFFVDNGNKEKLLLDLVKQKHLTSVRVFTRTKHRANKVSVYLNQNGIRADAIHGNK